MTGKARHVETNERRIFVHVMRIERGSEDGCRKRGRPKLKRREGYERAEREGEGEMRDDHGCSSSIDMSTSSILASFLTVPFDDEGSPPLAFFSSS